MTFQSLVNGKIIGKVFMVEWIPQIFLGDTWIFHHFLRMFCLLLGICWVGYDSIPIYCLVDPSVIIGIIPNHAYSIGFMADSLYQIVSINRVYLL